MPLFRDLFQLTKPRVVTLVTVTTALGYVLGALADRSWVSSDWVRMLVAVLGAILVCGGVGAVNQGMEERIDALMVRTRNRPVPGGRIGRFQAILFGFVLMLAGILLYHFRLGGLMALGAIVTAAIYLLVYTPLKRRTWWNTTIGAVPGALPPLGGWVAATGRLDDVGGWTLFTLLFLWQHPHFYAIAHMYRDEYGKAGLRMISRDDPGARKTIRHMLLWTAALLPFSLLPVRTTLPHFAVIVAGLLVSLWFLMKAVAFARRPENATARSVVKASVLYLPLVLCIKVVEVVLAR